MIVHHFAGGVIAVLIIPIEEMSPEAVQLPKVQP